MEKMSGVLIIILLEMLLYLGLIASHHLILTILKMTFSFSVKVQLLVLMESFGASEKKINITFTEAKTKFCSSLHYNADNSYLFVNGTEIYKFKSSNKNNSFPS